ncbi:hypothetical protein [Nonomuraea gerenzanensis]|uniref:hypothetical protein n=1 Tax=Nonomuraea gerenzanensis TaxID=93944 RepID=UPI001CDA11A4|nr:hypothetical protein [Nonomuraea gerenzanensis]UBU12525.1 hypothetical protein LCN96_51075 [Nonomuraea gerenzanensis]
MARNRSYDMIIDVEDATLPEFETQLRRWVSEVPGRLVPSLWERLNEALPLRTPSDWNEPHGESRGVWAVVCAETTGRGLEVRKFSLENHEWLIAGVGKWFPKAWIEIKQLDDGGRPSEDGMDGFRVEIERFDGDGDRIQLRAWSYLPDVAYDLARPEVAERWGSVLRDFADKLNPAFGHLADDSNPNGTTALDVSVARGGRVKSVKQARQILRGYSWITICPAELGERLGGVSGLSRTGAFHEVAELSRGGLWLQATKNFADYDERAVLQVFKALANVLPGGLPKRNPFDTKVRRLVWEDAAKHRTGEI